MSFESGLALMALAFACEVVDSSLGMGYGTILSPLLLLFGFPPLVAVPAVLLSQAVGGGVAAVFHHRLGNANFRKGMQETRVMLTLAGLCVVATILAALIGLASAPRTISLYIGFLVIVMGALIVANRRLRFTWGRMLVVGLVSAFNKGLSGGGFGPVVAGGLVIVGQEAKAAIATTTAAEVPVCIAGFLTYAIGATLNAGSGTCQGGALPCFFSQLTNTKVVPWDLTLLLCLGGGLAGLVGPRATRWLSQWRMHLILGSLILVLGVWTVIKSWR